MVLGDGGAKKIAKHKMLGEIQSALGAVDLADDLDRRCVVYKSEV